MNPDTLYGAIYHDGKWDICCTYYLDWEITADVKRDKLFFISGNDVCLSPLCVELINTCNLDGDIKEALSKGGPPCGLPWLMVCVDIERRVYVNGYFDLPLEDYAPEGWATQFGDPYDFVPVSITELWSECFEYKRRYENDNSSLLRRLWMFFRRVVPL